MKKRNFLFSRLFLLTALAGSSLLAFAAGEDYTNSIVNPGFEYTEDASTTFTPGQTAYRGDPYGWHHEGNLSGNSWGCNNDAKGYEGNAHCWYNDTPMPAAFSLYQVVSGLPAGHYRMTCKLCVFTGAVTNQRLFANNYVMYFGKESDYVSNRVEGEIDNFSNCTTSSTASAAQGGQVLSQLDELDFIIVEGENLTLGIRSSNKLSNGTSVTNTNAGWFKADAFKLTRVESIEDYAASLLAEANALKSKSMSDEARTDLENTISALQNSSTDSERKTAIEALKVAIKAAQKSNEETAWTYASKEYPHECQSLMKNPECNDRLAWDGSGRTANQGDHCNGNAEEYYFSCNFEQGNRNQNVTLPKKGTYMMSVAVRAAVGNKVVVEANGVSSTYVGQGLTGGTIATDGSEWASIDEGLAAGKSFANDNAGYGWVYQHVVFKTSADNQSVQIKLTMDDTSAKGLEYADEDGVSDCGGVRLVYVGDGESAVATTLSDGALTVSGYAAADDITPAEGVTSVTLTDARVTDGVVIETTASPNCLFYANEGQVDNANNVVVDGSCSSLVLTDKCDFAPKAGFQATNAQYNTSISTVGYATMILPYEVEVPEGITAMTLTGVSEEGVLAVAELTTIPANTAVLLASDEAVDNLGFAAENVNVTAEGGSVTGNLLVGVYQSGKVPCSSASATNYILQSNNDVTAFYKVSSDNLGIKPFRAYLSVEGEQNARVLSFDTVTAIEQIQQQSGSKCYTLTGVAAGSGYKGIVISNHKKLLKK